MISKKSLNRTIGLCGFPLNLGILVAVVWIPFFVLLAMAEQNQTADISNLELKNERIIKFAEACSLAFANSYSLKETQYRAISARKESGAIGAWDDPMLMVGVENLPTSFDFAEDMMTMTMVGLSMNMPYSGYKGLQKKAAKSGAESARYEIEISQNELYAAVLTAYANAYSKQEILRYSRAELELAEKAFESIRYGYMTATVAATEFALANAEIGKLKSENLSDEQQFQEAIAELLVLTGQPPPESNIIIEEMDIKIAELSEHSLDDRLPQYPAYSKVVMESEKYRYLSGAASRMRWPMMSLSGYYGFRQDSEMEKRNDMVGFQVTLALPVLSGWRQRNMSLSMDAMRKASDLQAEQILLEAKARSKLLLERIQRLKQAKETYMTQVLPADSLALNSEITAFSTGKASFNELVGLIRVLYQDLKTLVKYDFEIARAYAELTTYTGIRIQIAGN